MDKALELARCVLEWENVDDQVAEKGWVGSLDESWDRCRAKMVSLAAEIAAEAGKEASDAQNEA